MLHQSLSPYTLINCCPAVGIKKMSLESINIEKIVNGGFGFARLSTGQVTLVRYALPAETVTVTTEESKKNYLVCNIDKIITKHPGRISPPCRYYGQCGGCNLQHADYATQLEIKKGIIADQLGRQGNQLVGDSIDKLAEPIPSPTTLGYRQRIRLQVGELGILGFHRFQSHEIIPIDSCLLAGNSINKAITSLQQREDGRRLCELSTEVELQQNPKIGNIACIFHFKRKVRPADEKAAKNLCRNVPEIERVFFIGQDFPINGPYYDEQTPDTDEQKNTLTVHYPAIAGIKEPIELSWEVGGFCQVNLAQNRQLIETVLDFCRITVTESILDLYCGMGNFSIPLAMAAQSVLGIEAQAAAIRSAQKNAAKYSLSNTLFLKSSVYDGCRELAQKGEQFDCVLIDPPRLGTPEMATQLAALTASRLVYVSCDPATLCRDLSTLTEAGFTICKIQPVDMFPQTHHIETLVLLQK